MKSLPALLLASVAFLPRYAGRRRVEAWRTAYLWLVAIVPLAIHLFVGFDKGVIREIADVGHMIHWFEPAALATELADFFAEHGA